ncbi:MAG: hypothetical protein ACFCU4_01350 [Puniceicoccaceae bacterium]
MPRPHPILGALALVALLFPLAPSSGATAVEPTPVKVSLSFLSLDVSINDLFFLSEDDPIPFLVPNAAPSQPYPYFGSTTLHLYRQTDPSRGLPSTDPAQLPPPIATVQLDPQGKDLLLLFVSSGRDTPKVYTLSNDLGTFPANSFRFFNLCHFKVAGQLNSESFQIPPRSQQIIPLTEAGHPQITVQLATLRGDDWKRVYRSKWRFNPLQRLNVFFIPDENQPSGIRIRRYYELAPEGEPPTSPEEEFPTME